MDFFPMALLCVALFLSGFVDSIAGGGGIISMPAFMLTGLPMHVVYGVNKFTAASGTTFSTLRYLKNGAMDVKVACISAAGAFVGSFVFSQIVLLLPETFLKGMLLAMMPVLIVLVLVKKKGADVNQSVTLPLKRKVLFSMLIGLLVGAYDGLFGPGTGTIAILAYTYIMKYDLKTAGGNAKLLNLSSNYASLFTYIFAGVVDYSIAIPAAVCCIAGNFFGAGLALKKGSAVIRPIMVLVAVLLMGKTALEFLTF